VSDRLKTLTRAEKLGRDALVILARSRLGRVLSTEEALSGLKQAGGVKSALDLLATDPGSKVGELGAEASGILGVILRRIRHVFGWSGKP
jgi:hypothetical protein